MNNSYRILFMGTPDFAVPSLKALCENGYKPAAIYTQPDKINGRGKKIVFSPVKEFALENNIPCCQPDSLKTEDEIERIANLPSDRRDFPWKLPWNSGERHEVRRPAECECPI